MTPGLRPGSSPVVAVAAELKCLRGREEVWSDRLEKCGVISLVASPHFFALTTTHGELIVYSLGGRRILPTIPLGSLAAFIATDVRPPPPPLPASLALRVGGGGASTSQPLPQPPSTFSSSAEGGKGGKGGEGGEGGKGGKGGEGHKLLVATLDGRIRVWDLLQGLLVIEASTEDLAVEAVAAQGGLGASVATAKMSSHGLPFMILSNGNAFCYQPGLKVWMKMWDTLAALTPHSSGPALPFALSTNLGDLATIQGAAQKQQGPIPHAQLIAQASASNANALMHQRNERVHLETNIAAALALGSPSEYKRWLVVYVRKLSVDGDHGRLRELLKGLIDPRSSPSPAPAPAPAPGDNDDEGSSSILGHPRVSLFKEMMKEAVRNKASQVIQDMVQELMEVHSDVMHVAMGGGGGGIWPWGGGGGGGTHLGEMHMEGTSRGKKRQIEL